MERPVNATAREIGIQQRGECVPILHITDTTVTTRPFTLRVVPSVVQLFVEYYKKQGVVPEGQWDEFMEVLKTPLPTTFRINGTGKFAIDLRDKLESDFLSNFNKDPIMV